LTTYGLISKINFKFRDAAMHADPPRDGNGKILPHDHPEILETHHVIRHTTPNDLTFDLQTGKHRIASGAFSESSGGGMSVDIEEWMAADGLPPCFTWQKRLMARLGSMLVLCGNLGSR
jgi:hypothetical protein